MAPATYACASGIAAGPHRAMWFTDQNEDAPAIVVSMVLEGATIVLLGAHLVLRRGEPAPGAVRRRVSAGRHPQGQP